MKFFVIYFFLVPFFVFAEEFELSTPKKTYESCVQNQLEPISYDFMKAFLDNCITREGKISDVKGMIFATAFILPAKEDERFSSWYSDLENIFGNYLDLSKEGHFNDLDKLSDSNLNNFYLDLANYIEEKDPSNDDQIEWEIAEVIYSEDEAKAILLNPNSLEYEESELFFKKINSKWLIHREANDD